MYGKHIHMATIDELHKIDEDKPKRIYITTGRGMGKGFLQHLLYEKCLNLETTELKGPFELEKLIEFWNKYDEVKENSNMHPINDPINAVKVNWHNVGPDNMVLVRKDKFEIKDIIVNHPATIVLWEDGTKTVVKCENEEFDLEKAIAMAFARKALGNKYGYYNVFKKWLKKDKVKNFSNKK